MVSAWVRFSGLLVVRKQINRNWANQLPWLPRELVFSEWKNVSCSPIHPSILDFACWFLLIDYQGSEWTSTYQHRTHAGRMDGVWTRNIFSLVTPWTRNIFSLVTPAQVDENRSNMDRKGKSLLSPTLLEATEVQPKNYFILFLKTTHAN